MCRSFLRQLVFLTHHLSHRGHVELQKQTDKRPFGSSINDLALSWYVDRRQKKRRSITQVLGATKNNSLPSAHKNAEPRLIGGPIAGRRSCAVIEPQLRNRRSVFSGGGCNPENSLCQPLP